MIQLLRWLTHPEPQQRATLEEAFMMCADIFGEGDWLAVKGCMDPDMHDALSIAKVSARTCRL